MVIISKKNHPNRDGQHRTTGWWLELGAVVQEHCKCRCIPIDPSDAVAASLGRAEWEEMGSREQPVPDCRRGAVSFTRELQETSVDIRKLELVNILSASERDYSENKMR